VHLALEGAIRSLRAGNPLLPVNQGEVGLVIDNVYHAIRPE
jgi:hypothetical protein